MSECDRRPRNPTLASSVSGLTLVKATNTGSVSREEYTVYSRVRVNSKFGVLEHIR